ncbi:MAG: zf-HC2 domain-containing protein [Gemmatimonadaceae bacterium]|nr:zf-HC2 domain-containing protein [Gemmatimonadaceae bacterium]
MPQSMELMDCRRFRKHHFAYLDDTLSGDDMAAAQRHILACNACAAHDTLVRRSLMMAKSLPTIEPSVAFQQRLQARLAECRVERDAQQTLRPTPSTLMAPMPSAALLRASWLSPRTAVAAIAASAVVGTMMWREVSTPSVPVVAMEPVIATAPVRPEARYVSPALLQAMATGNPVWPATVILEEAPNNFVNVDYSMSTMSSLDDRQ